MESSAIQTPTASRERLPVLKVLLDARKLGHGGIGTYLETIISGLREKERVQLALLVSKEVFESKVLRVRYNIEGLRLIASGNRPNSIGELFFMSKKLPLKEFDIYHSPHYILPYGITIPTVVTIHDLIHISHPQKFYYPLVAKTLMKSALRRAKVLIADSNATAWQLRRMFKINAASHSIKLKVLPVILDKFFADLEIRRQNQVDGQYYLTICSQPKPHKGIEDLLNALVEFYRADENGAIKFVLAGQGTSNLHRIVSSRYPSLKSHVSVLGKVSKERLASLYSRAKAVVIPSLAEGFGLPVVEAHACGTPVLVRPVPALCELVDPNCDLITRDFSIEALTEGLIGMKSRPALNDRQASEISSEFSAAKIIPQLVEIYDSVCFQH